MSLLSLLFTISLLSFTAFANAPQLSCTRTDKGQQQQLTIASNALGSHDVSLHTRERGHPPQLTWLALQLDCEVQKGIWHCVAAQDSPHAHSTLHSKELASGQGLEISITSPLLSEGKELASGKELESGKESTREAEQSLVTYRFASEQCVTQAQVPREAFTPSSSLCLAHFNGAYYEPNQGDCVEASASGCRNPFPYHSRPECRAALKL